MTGNLFSTESQFIIQTMTRMDDILTLAAEIVRRFKPERVILFGSYCHGAPTADSDVDLLVIMPGEAGMEHPAHQQVKILQAIEAPFPLDLLVRTSGEISERIAGNDFFMRDIMTKGKVLYASANAGMGGKG
jgi:predicted nucleotidyltransferase